MKLASHIYRRVTENGTCNSRLRVKREMKRHEIRNRKLSELHAEIRAEVNTKAREIENSWNPNRFLENMVDWAAPKRAAKPELSPADFPPDYFASLSGKGGKLYEGEEN